MSSQSVVIKALGLLPKNHLSRLAGRAAGWTLPAPLRGPILRTFGAAVGVDWSEIRDPIESFATLQSFFTRALVPGARPIDGAADAFVSPCDGTWGQSGIVRAGELLQVKGRPYALASLLGDAEISKQFEGGPFATLYLSPRDYHRFHASCDVRVVAARYIPGELWPVNRVGVEGVAGLFAQNERVCAFMRLLDSGTSARPDAALRDAAREAEEPPQLCMVAVGATMVGKIRLTFDDLTTNVAGRAESLSEYQDPVVALRKGEQWGHFEFGSTIVLVAAPGVLDLDVQPAGTKVQLGTKIGRLLAGGTSIRRPLQDV